MVPLMLAVTPQGLTLGLALGQLPTGKLAAWSTSGLIYSGSAQLALVSAYAGGAGLAAALVALVINARFLFYSAAVAPHWRGQPLGWRLLAGYLLVDPSFAHAQERQGEPGSPGEKAAHYLGGAVLLFCWWQAVTAIGVLLPSVVPHVHALSAAAPLCFVALLAGAVKDRRALAAAGTALVAGVALATMPGSAGLGVAMVLGIAAGELASRSRRPAAPAAAAPAAPVTPAAPAALAAPAAPVAAPVALGG
jgi:predicted branched-subunit amino acid permease